MSGLKRRCSTTLAMKIGLLPRGDEKLETFFDRKIRDAKKREKNAMGGSKLRRSPATASGHGEEDAKKADASKAANKPLKKENAEDAKSIAVLKVELQRAKDRESSFAALASTKDK
eukprot:3777126-Prymnesium_polylepis.1